MATLLKIAEDMQELTVVVKLRARELTKFVSLRMLQYLAEQTPVDTSKAISNWRVALGGNSYGAEPIPAHFIGSRGSTRQSSITETVNAAKEALRSAAPGKAIAIFNAAPHIKRLNEGWSSQHPGGFVEASILVGRHAVREYNFKAKVKRGRPKTGEL